MANNSKTRCLFGFTSPRTIEKIIPEIELLTDDYLGMVWSGNQELQSEFFEKLFDSDFYEGDTFPEDPAFAARDRMTRAPKALGFIDLKPKILLTDAGKALLRNKRIDEVITKQLLKFQLPSPYHKGFPIEFAVKPYLELLRLAVAVKSLSKVEIALFFTQIHHHNKFDLICEKIQAFRKNAKLFKGSWRTYVDDCFYREISEVYDEEISSKKLKTRESNEISLAKFINTKKSNMLDYADAFVRYLRATQLITFEKRSFRIIPSQTKFQEIQYILNNINKEPIIFKNESEFKSYLFASDNIQLLNDNKELLLAKLKKLKINVEKKDINIEELKELLLESEIKIKKDLIVEKTEELKGYKEYDEIMEVFDQITKKRVPDPPLFLEWNIWRSWVMINYARKIEGNFSIDLDGMPLNTAPGNKPDIEADYEGFDLIIEVTMSSGHTQYRMENESVPRHFGVVKSEKKNELYCVFIAPKISEGTLAHYFNLNKMNTKFYGGQTRIIPISLEDFKKFLQVAKKYGFNNPDKLRIWLSKLWEFNQSCENEIEWTNKISQEIENWAA